MARSFSNATPLSRTLSVTSTGLSVGESLYRPFQCDETRTLPLIRRLGLKTYSMSPQFPCGKLAITILSPITQQAGAIQINMLRQKTDAPFRRRELHRTRTDPAFDIA